MRVIDMVYAPLQPFVLRSTDRFQIEAQISNGGSGTVWLGYDKLLCSTVAIKSMFQWSSEISLLRAEVLAGRKIQSPHVIRIYELIELQRTYCIVMQYIAGTTLSKVLKRIVLPEDAKRLILQLCQGVFAIHQAGFAHCDLRSNNILVSYDGDLTVVDLGSTKTLREGRAVGCRLISADVSALSLLSAEIAEAAFRSGANDYWLKPLIEKCLQPFAVQRYATAVDLLEEHFPGGSANNYCNAGAEARFSRHGRAGHEVAHFVLPEADCKRSVGGQPESLIRPLW